MTTNPADDGGIDDITDLEPGQAPVYTPEIDGPDVRVTVHGAATGDAGPMLLQADVQGHGFYLYALVGIDESGGEDRFAVVPDSHTNTHAERAIGAMGGVVVDE